MMVAGAVWEVAYALELASGDPASRAFWGETKYIGVVAIPYAWLVFALRFSGKDDRLSRRRLLLLGIVPLLTLALVFTNEAHHLIREYADPVLADPFEIVHGPWFWVHSAYSYALLGTGTVVLLSTLRGYTGLYRGQYAAVAVGALVPWAANALYVLKIGPLGDLDPTPFIFALTGAAFLLGLRRFEFLELVPVAREAMVEEMQDGFVVADRRGRVIDLNRAASRALGVPITEAHGTRLADVLPNIPIEQDASRDGEARASSGELRVGAGERERFYEVSVSPLDSREAASGNIVILLRDVTKRKRAEEALKRSEERFRQLFENSVEALLVHDEQGRYVDCNAQACRLYGYAREEILELSVDDLSCEMLSEEQRAQKESEGGTLWQRALWRAGRLLGRL